MTKAISSKSLRLLIKDEVNDPELRARLSRLGAPHLDTIIREAGVVLEDRIRAASGLTDLFGAELVGEAFDPKKKILVFSDHLNEQSGVKLLYMGAMQFIRNPPMHKLTDYSVNQARSLLKLLDALLTLLPVTSTGDGRKRSPAFTSSQEFIDTAKESGAAELDLLGSILSQMEKVAGFAGRNLRMAYRTSTANLYWQESNGRTYRFFSVNAKNGVVTVWLTYLRDAGYEVSADKLERIAIETIPGIRGQKSGAIRVSETNPGQISELIVRLSGVFDSQQR